MRITSPSLLLFCLLLFLAALPSGSALAGDVYSVSGVDVEATASTAVRARQAAILEGHSIALTRLLQRLTLPEDWGKLPRLAGKDAQLLSLGYSTAGERRSATRYLGQISVRFVAERIQELLKENNIPFGDVQTSPVLVIPVYDLPNGRRLIWENQNIWRAAWGRPDIGESLTPFILPVGDLEDIQALPTRAASVNNRGALFRLARRYNVRRVLLAHAKLEEVDWKGTSGYALSVRLSILNDRQNTSGDESMTFAVSGAASGKNSGEALVQQGVDNILQMTGISWKRRIIVYSNEASSHEVRLNFNSLLEWQRVRRLLDEVSVLTNYQILRLDNKSALLVFNYSGSKDILSIALKQKNLELTLTEEEDEPWILKRGR